MTVQEELVQIAGIVEGAWQLAQAQEEQGSHDALLADWSAERARVVAELGQSPRLTRLKSLFDLEQWQLALLLLTALPHMDPRYRSLYAELHPERQPFPCLEMLLNVLCAYPERKQSGIQVLLADSSLLTQRLLVLPEKAGNLMTGEVRIAPDVIDYLWGAERQSQDIHQCLHRVDVPEHDLIPLTEPVQSPLVQLTGIAGSGRRTTALQTATQRGHPLYELDINRLWQFTEPLDTLRDILRFVALADGELFWPDGLQALAERPAAAKQVAGWGGHCLWFSGEQPCQWPPLLANRQPVSRRLVIPDLNASEQLWATLAEFCCGDPVAVNAPVDWTTIAQRYRLSPGDMLQVLLQLRQTGEALTTDAILSQCLARTPATLSGLASRVIPQHRFEDLVLTGDVRSQLEELAGRYHLRRPLCEKGLCQVAGLQVLFWGRPGTGKTMAAEALASHLKLPLYKANLANIASKWIGETEKHLASLFDEVEHHNGILFFDEADAIFAQRSKVESSHDKNANLGVSYLLQRIEHFQGLLILATNFKGNLDKAFLRRLHFSIEFPLPDSPARRELWARWAALLPLAEDVETESLAAQLELNGAQIRNIAQQAMALAMHDNEQQPQVRREHLRRAIRREYQKNDNSFLVSQQLAGWFNESNRDDSP
ncbi:ATP-binding protein [Kistimonas asteriae]|uniref:ATP-binding protein n=1 Tax=Kistimonas asteriae TaxID=517724 RepID=UPI001BA9D94F|nr:ATP-binding protein [Kistimonas asteriae]